MIYRSHITGSKNDDRQELDEDHSECRRLSAAPSPLLPPIERMFAGAFQRVMPSKRDREVPYGMKGGEPDGRKEESRS
jgi:hypothetical protein